MSTPGASATSGLARDEPAAVLHAAGDLRIERRPIPKPSQHEVLVQVAAVGICGSDVHYVEHGSLGPNVVRKPHILGHEVSGRVIALGAAVTGHEIGERVVLEPGLPCRECIDCLAGRYNLCTRTRFLGAPPLDGALRGHVAIDAGMVFTLPRSLSDEEGALIEPLAVAVWACRRAGLTATDRVLVTGAGPIGLLTAQVARSGGAHVTIVDINPHRLELAGRLGIDDARDPGELAGAGLRVDALIECSGSSAALAAGLEAIRPGGTVVLVGMPPENVVTVPLEFLQRRELTITGSFRYRGCFPEAIELAASGKVALEPLITGRYPLEGAVSALRASREDPAAVKAIVLPNG